MAALGPGMGMIACPCSRKATTRRKPGSLMSGVPASEMSATRSPAAMRSTMRVTWRDSLCS